MGDSYLERDTWSDIPMESWELDALIDMLNRIEPATPAEQWMRQRLLDAQCRRDQVTQMKERDGHRPRTAD